MVRKEETIDQTVAVMAVNLSNTCVCATERFRTLGLSSLTDGYMSEQTGTDQVGMLFIGVGSMYEEQHANTVGLLAYPVTARIFTVSDKTVKC